MRSKRKIARENDARLLAVLTRLRAKMRLAFPHNYGTSGFWTRAGVVHVQMRFGRHTEGCVRGGWGDIERLATERLAEGAETAAARAAGDARAARAGARVDDGYAKTLREAAKTIRGDAT